jgi:predicted acetyltransferase
VGRTIAPVVIAGTINPVAFLDTLIAYKHQAYGLGWITNKGIFNSLDQKLDNARKQLERGNNRAARNILAAFINEVEAQKEKHLSSEAYALLKFNAEYLISKLQ